MPITAHAAEPVGTATLTEVDVPGTLIEGAAAVDLAAAGYTETEYYASGTANRYNGTASTTTTATVLDGNHPYTTRVVVRTPSADKFNGTLVVEWNNVTIGLDGEFVFAESNEYLLREGYGVAAISAQRVGVEHLKAWEPTRYGGLNVDVNLCGAGTSLCTGDPLSWDIFTQVAKAVADNNGGALAGLEVQNVIATGQSQSAGRLSTYYNTIQPIYDYFDGFVYHDRAAPLRTDVPTPAVGVHSDAIDSLGIRPTWASSAWTRVWELAGGTHASEWGRQYMDRVFTRDQGLLRNGVPISFTQWLEPTCAVVDTATGGQFGPVDTGYVLNAAFESVRNWIRTGEPAPASIYYERDAAGVPIRDAQHISQGGIHLPALVAPTMYFDSWNGPPYLFPCAVGGYHIDYTAEELEAMYGTHGSYVSQISQTAEELVAAGYLLEFDAEAEIRNAAQSDVAKNSK